MSKELLQTGERYRHYKGGLYQIVTLAVHTETEEEMVVYQALYGEYRVFVRPLSMFFDEVRDSEGNTVRRFEREAEGAAYKTYREQQKEPEQHEKPEQPKKSEQPEKPEQPQKPEKSEQTEKSKRQEKSGQQENSEEYTEEIPEGVSRLLIEFLDAGSCSEKLEVLHDMRKSIDDKTISDIAAAMDFVIEDGSVEDRLRELENCLKTRARYETMRLR